MDSQDELDVVERLAATIARSAVDALERVSPMEQSYRLCMGLESVRPGLSYAVYATLGVLVRDGIEFRQALERSIADAISDVLLDEVTRLLACFDGTAAALGIDQPPDGGGPDEQDDIVRHNVPADPKKPGEQPAWEERQYRGLWWPAFMTPIRDLTPDDMGLASAFLAAKLTQKKFPTSDLAQQQMNRLNRKRNIFFKIQSFLEVIGTAIMGALYGPIGAAAVKLVHKGKMALIGHFWKAKVVRDPALQMMLNKLVPTGPFNFRGFAYRMLPVGNMLVQELGCTGDLATRLLLHGRMLRTLDVLVASAPTAKSAAGRYDYPSSFGLLRGSIFPPRGPGFDGQPPGKPIMDQVNQIMATPAMREAVARPSMSLAHTAESIVHLNEVPRGLQQSLSNVRSRLMGTGAQDGAQFQGGKPKTSFLVPALLVGGGALAVLLAMRHRAV